MFTTIRGTDTACNYAGFLWNLYSLGWRDQNAGPKRCYYSQASRAQSPLNAFCTWCNMLLTVVAPLPSFSPQILLYSPFTSTFFFPPHVHESYGTGNYIVISGSLKVSNFHRIFDLSKNMYKNIFVNLYSTVLIFFKLLFLYNNYKIV